MSPYAGNGARITLAHFSFPRQPSLLMTTDDEENHMRSEAEAPGEDVIRPYPTFRLKMVLWAAWRVAGADPQKLGSRMVPSKLPRHWTVVASDTAVAPTSGERTKTPSYAS
jgi:hypothetical protein